MASALGCMSPLSGKAGTFASHRLLTREIHFSDTLIVACVLIDWQRGLLQGGQVGELEAWARHQRELLPFPPKPQSRRKTVAGAKASSKPQI